MKKLIAFVLFAAFVLSLFAVPAAADIPGSDDAGEIAVMPRGFLSLDVGDDDPDDNSLFFETTAAITLSVEPAGLSEDLSPVEAETGKNITLSAPVFAHYSFVGWYKNGVLISESAEFEYYVTGSVTLVARYESVPSPGDANADGEVNTLDLTLVRQRLADPATEVSSGADADRSGTVDSLDLTLLRRYLADPSSFSGS